MIVSEKNYQVKNKNVTDMCVVLWLYLYVRGDASRITEEMFTHGKTFSVLNFFCPTIWWPL